MSDLRTLLPPNAQKIELELEQLSARLRDVADPIRTLWNSETCPEHLLPYLAWALSVEVWDASWPESHRRKVIANAVQIHRQKGTVGSVRRVLADIGFNTDIVEWFDSGAEPHTFRVDAFGDDIFDAGFQIKPELAASIARMIENVKPVRAHFTLRIGEKKGGTVTLRTGSLQRAEDHRHITPALPVDTHAPQLSARTGHRGRRVSREIHRFDMGEAA